MAEREWKVAATISLAANRRETNYHGIGRESHLEAKVDDRGVFAEIDGGTIDALLAAVRERVEERLKEFEVEVRRAANKAEVDALEAEARSLERAAQEKRAKVASITKGAGHGA